MIEDYGKQTLKVLIERMKRYRSIYEQNEMAVRDQLVNPVLRSLGWDPEKPEDVQPNLSTEEGIPDYSLLKNRKKVLFVEAKKLSVDVERKDVLRQLARYCFGLGVKFGILTNGAIWVLFRAFEEGTTITERIVWKADIEKDKTTANIRKLQTISKENIEKVDVLVKKLQILDEIWKSLLDDPKDLIKGLMPIFGNMIKEAYIDYEFENIEIEDFIKERVKDLVSPPEEHEIVEHPVLKQVEWGKTRPRKMKISTDTYEIIHSYDILVNTAEWLINRGKLRKDVCPIIAGHKRNLVNTEPKHRSGKHFTVPKKLSNGLYIEVHYSTASCIKYARRLVEQFGYSDNILTVE